MLFKTHKALKTLKDSLPFETNIMMFLSPEEDLIIQTIFRKDNVPYFYCHSYMLNNIIEEDFEALLWEYILAVKDFYDNLNPADYPSVEMPITGQTIH